jgi:hypothetical protein
MNEKIDILEIDKVSIIKKITEEPVDLFAESQSKIGNGYPGHEASITLFVHVPLIAQITFIKGFLRNAAWPEGIDLGNTSWHEANLIRYHEPIGWSYAGHLTKGSTPTSQWVSATFVNWIGNPRYGMLKVYYTIPVCKEGGIVFDKIDKILISQLPQ